jgi:hypothetical protein
MYWAISFWSLFRSPNSYVFPLFFWGIVISLRR